MNTLRDRDRDATDYRQQRSDYRDRGRDQDREISLGTGTILGIFFALALLCAVFFGFGYSMGRKSAQPILAAGTSSSTGLFGGLKPAPGNPKSSSPSARSSAPGNTSAAEPETDAPETASSQSFAAPPAAPAEHTAPAPRQTPVIARSAANPTSTSSGNQDAFAPAASKPSPKPVNTPLPPQAAAPPQPLSMPAISPNGTMMVQVAAVSHQEDADLLLSALRNRGYAVFIRQEPQDHLLHVQVGPFATKKDAEAMRQHLLSDGYNAIVK